MNHREVDLVIKNEIDLERILKFLIFKLSTVDGKRDSGLNIISALNN